MAGFIARVLSFTRLPISGDVKAQLGGRIRRTLPHFDSPGEDSPPLVVDKGVGLHVEGTGTSVGVGYVDTINPGTALPGEKRLLGRTTVGAIVSEIFQRADGSILIKNPFACVVVGSEGAITLENLSALVSLGVDGAVLVENEAGGAELSAAGLWTINGATITTDGDVVTADGISLNNHTHAAGGYAIAPDPVTGVSGVAQ